MGNPPFEDVFPIDSYWKRYIFIARLVHPRLSHHRWQMSPGSCSTLMSSGLLPWHRAVQLLWRMKVQPGEKNRNLKPEKERWVYIGLLYIYHTIWRKVLYIFVHQRLWKHRMCLWMYIHQRLQDICWSRWKKYAGFYIGDLVDLPWWGCLKSSLGSS